MALIPPTILAVPLPWLTSVAGALFGDTSSTVRKLKFWKRTKLTGDFWRYFTLTILIGFAALNTGNNLLYLVVAMLLSLLIISGMMGDMTLFKVRVERRLPRHIFAGKSAHARYDITNGKTLFSSYSFDVKEAPATSALPHSLSPSLTDEETGGDASSGAVYIVKLGPSATVSPVARYTFPRRGLVRLEALELRTRFPFGLILKTWRSESAEEVMVYPTVRAVKGPVRIAGGGTTVGEAQAARRGGGTQLYGLREYTLADDARFIHWRSAAREKRLLVKEFEDERERAVTVLFNNCLDRRKGAEDGDRFERLVEEAASLASHFMERGYSVGLKTLSDDVRPARSTEHLYKILRALALVGAEGPEGAPTVTAVRA